jgi:hypothetical protein
MPSCPNGYVEKRDWFGFRTECIRSRTKRARKSANVSTKKNRGGVYIPSIKSLARMACPPGMIERKAYKRKFRNSIRKKGYTVTRSGTTYRVYPKAQSATVAAACVKDSGKNGKHVPKSIGPSRKGELSKYGYSFRKTSEKRREALKKAIKAYGALGVFRKLDAVYKLSENKMPRVAEIFKQDRNWVYLNYESISKAIHGK